MRLPEVLPIPDEVLEIARRLEDAGHETWCVGGALRDALLGGESSTSDFDLATSATPAEVQRLFRRTVPVGVRHGTVGVLDRRRALHEVTTFRRDVETDGRHAVVVYGVSLNDDLARRDFTINAMAYHPLRHEWRDPFRGVEDLARGMVRAVGAPAERFREDYLRILRALRFAARFGFAIEPETWAAARAAAPGLSGLSAERVREEWYKGLRSARSVVEFAVLWREAGAAETWLPELDPDRLSTEAGAGPPPGPRDPVILTAWLTTDAVGVLRRLKASNAEIGRALALAAGPGAPAGAGGPSVRRWLAAVGPAAGDLIALATLRAGSEPPWAAAVRAARDRGDPITRGDLAIGGTELAELGLSGARIGETLARLLDRVHQDPALNTRESLLRLARESA